MGYQPITDLKEGVSERNCGKIVKSLNYLIAYAELPIIFQGY